MPFSLPPLASFDFPPSASATPVYAGTSPFDRRHPGRSSSFSVQDLAPRPVLLARPTSVLLPALDVTFSDVSLPRARSPFSALNQDELSSPTSTGISSTWRPDSGSSSGESSVARSASPSSQSHEEDALPIAGWGSSAASSHCSSSGEGSSNALSPRTRFGSPSLAPPGQTSSFPSPSTATSSSRLAALSDFKFGSGSTVSSSQGPGGASPDQRPNPYAGHRRQASDHSSISSTASSQPDPISRPGSSTNVSRGGPRASSPVRPPIAPRYHSDPPSHPYAPGHLHAPAAFSLPPISIIQSLVDLGSPPLETYPSDSASVRSLPSVLPQLSPSRSARSSASSASSASISTAVSSTSYPRGPHPYERKVSSASLADEPTGGYPRAQISRTSRACDHCRSRKTKCIDVAEDGCCSRCRESGVACIWSGAGKKRGPYSSPRVSVSAASGSPRRPDALMSPSDALARDFDRSASFFSPSMVPSVLGPSPSPSPTTSSFPFPTSVSSPQPHGCPTPDTTSKVVPSVFTRPPPHHLQHLPSRTPSPGLGHPSSSSSSSSSGTRTPPASRRAAASGTWSSMRPALTHKRAASGGAANAGAWTWAGARLGDESGWCSTSAGFAARE